MIDNDKRIVGKWWMWILLLVVISSVILTSLKYMGVVGGTIIERVVFENSYQKVAADKKAKNVFAAQLAEVEYKLSGKLDDETRQQLEAQAAMLRIQARSIEQ